MEQREVLQALSKIGAARRGQISEQWFESRGRDGQRGRTGPYYVWQRSLRGRKVSLRIPRDEAPRALAELARGKQAAALIEQFWDHAEAATTVKKTVGKTRKPRLDPNCAKRPS
jgi:hypothetical protein